MMTSGALMNRRRTGPLEGEVAFSGFQWPLKAKSPSDFRLSKADSEEPSTLEGRVGENPEGLSRSFQLFETLDGTSVKKYAVAKPNNSSLSSKSAICANSSPSLFEGERRSF